MESLSGLQGVLQWSVDCKFITLPPKNYAAFMKISDFYGAAQSTWGEVKQAEIWMQLGKSTIRLMHNSLADL